MKNILNDVLTLAEGNELLGRGRTYLNDMIAAGKLIEGEHYRVAGRVKLITRSVVNQIKKGVFGMEKNFKEVGYWWNDKEIELVEIDDTVYALNGWDGEQYNHCWICSGENNMDASEEEYTIRPEYIEIDEDEFEIIKYNVN